jgi:hypothetical protein
MGRNSWCGWPTVVAVSHTFHIAGNHTIWLLMMYVSHLWYVWEFDFGGLRLYFDIYKK